MIECPNCGAMIDDNEIKCRYCSHPLVGGGEDPAVNERFQGDAPHAPEPPVVDPAPAQRTDSSQGYVPPYAQQQGQPSYQPPYQQPGPQSQYQGQPNYQNQQYAPPPPPQGQPYGQPPQGYPPMNQGYGVDGQYRDISKITAGLLAIFLGGIGVHKFYMGKIGIGIVYIVFCLTGIPAIIGLVEGIIYLCMDDVAFREKYARRF